MHRLAYSVLVGPIPAGMQIDHTCRTTLCVRPDHLEAVTAAENSRRHAATITHCPQGHEYTPENTYYDPKRKCRECNRIRCRERAARRRRGG